MPVPGFDGNGNYVRQYSWVADKTNGVPITSSRMDTEDNGFAAGLTQCVTRDGQGKMAADFLPTVNNTYNLGSAGLRWKDLHLSGTLTLDNALALTGGGTGATSASGARTNLGLGNLATLSADGNINHALRGDGNFGTLAVAAITGLAASATTDTTNATNISSGTLNPARLPAAAITDAGKSLSANGYVELSNGLIIQWGTGTPSGGTLAVTFPIAFPTRCGGISAITVAGGAVQTWISSPSTSGVNISNTSSTTVFWIAVGY